MKRLLAVVILLAIAASADGKDNVMKIRLKIDGKAPVTATLTDNPASRDFASLLPLKLTMKDLFGREKYAHLPRPISDAAPRTETYEVGQVVYWPPGPDVAVYYRHDGQSIDGGVIVLGKVDAGVDALNVRGTVNVTIERVK